MADNADTTDVNNLHREQQSRVADEEEEEKQQIGDEAGGIAASMAKKFCEAPGESTASMSNT